MQLIRAIVKCRLENRCIFKGCCINTFSFFFQLRYEFKNENNTVLIYKVNII